jgi:hypothetical protein
MRKLLTPIFCVAGFVLIAAPIYMKTEASPLTINGKSFGNVVMVNGVQAISIEDFSRAIGGAAKAHGSTLSLDPQWATTSSGAMAHGSGGGEGKASFHDISVSHRVDKASAVIYREGKPYVALFTVVRLMGGTLPPQTSAGQGTPININFAPAPDAIIAVRH